MMRVSVFLIFVLASQIGDLQALRFCKYNCPICYTLVEKSLSLHCHKTQKIKQTICDIESRPNEAVDGHFREEFEVLEDDIWGLIGKILIPPEQNGIIDEMRNKNKKIADVSKGLNKVYRSTILMDRIIKENNITLEEAQSVQKNLIRLQNETQNVLTKPSNENGNATLTQMAEEAQNLVHSLHKNATNIAKEAKLNSTAASNKCNSTTDPGKIHSLLEDLKETEAILNSTLRYATNITNKSRQIKEEASKRFEDMMGLIIPKLSNLPEIIGNFTLSKELRDSTENKTKRARAILVAAKGQVQDLNATAQKFSEIDDSLGNTIDEWNKKLDEAYHLYDTLNGTLNGTETGVQKSEKALKTIPEIQKRIDEVVRQVGAAQGNLTRLIGIFKNETSELFKKATKLNEEATELIRNQTETLAAQEEILRNLMEHKLSNSSLADEAGTKMKESNDEINELAKLIRDIETLFETASSDFNETVLDSLERDIDDVEKLYKDFKFKGTDKKPESSQDKQMKKRYKNEIKKLENEVKKIQVNIDSLPEGCFKSLKLEE